MYIFSPPVETYDPRIDGFFVVLKKRFKAISEKIMARLFFDHCMPAGSEFRRKIEEEEREDRELKNLRNMCAITGDMSAVIAYKQHKKRG